MKKLLLTTTAMVLLSATAALAMPPVAMAVAGAISAFGSTVIGGMIMSAALSYGASYLIQKFFGEDVEVQGVRQRMETGGDKPMSFLWGETATSGKLVYFNEYGESGGVKNLWLTQVIVLSDLPVSGLSNYLWVNGERCIINNNGNNDAYGFSTVAEYYKDGNDYLYVKFYDGSQTNPDPFLRDKYGNDPTRPWKSDMIGRGEAYIIINSRFSQKGLWSGVPSFMFTVKGMKLYDLRKDSTAGGNGSQRWADPSTWTWSDNLAVAKYNFIRGVSYNNKWLWGGQKNKVAAYRLPAANWMAAMNVCDQPITKKNGAVIRRFTGGGEITVNTPPLTVINEIDKSSNAHTTELGGIFKTWVGEPGLSVFTFTDDDVIISEGQEDDLFKPLQDTFNAATATYTEPNKGWSPKEAPGYNNAAYQAEDDNQELIADLSFPMVYEVNQVQRLMRAIIKESRRQRTHVMQLPPNAWFLEPMDPVTFNSKRNGYINKKFIVTSIDDLPNCNQLVSIREWDPTDYDWNVIYELDSEVGPISPVKPGPIDLLYTCIQSTITDANGKHRRPAISLLWDWADADMDVKAIQYIVRRVGTTKIVHRGRTNDPTDGIHEIAFGHMLAGSNYEVAARAMPITPNRLSNWSAWMPVVTANIRLANEDIADLGIVTGNLAVSAATDQVTSWSSGNINVWPGGSNIEVVFATHGSGAEGVSVFGQFKNVSGAAMTVDVEFWRGDNTWSVKLSNIVVAQNGFFFGHAMHKNPSGDKSYYYVRLWPSVAGTINQSRMTAISNKK